LIVFYGIYLFCDIYKQLNKKQQPESCTKEAVMATLPHENLDVMRDVTTSCVYNAYCNCNDIQIYDTTPLEIIFSVLHVNVHKRQSFKVEKNKTERKMYPDT